jgi:hypothetical protein
MGQARYKLPKDPQKLCRILDNHVQREETRMAYRRLTWLVAWYYINGARRFDVFNPETGALNAHFVDTEGNMEFQSGELLSVTDRTVGRLKEIDLWPKVVRSDNSLDAVRERSVMQVLLDAAIDPGALDTAISKYVHLYVLLGSCGITAQTFNSPARGLSTDFEVIHPKELFPYPSYGTDFSKVGGLVRQRVVPYEWLKARFGRRIERNRDKMEIYEAPVGSVAAVESDETTEGAGATGGRTRWNFEEGAGGPTDKDISMQISRIRELWVTGPGTLCSEYVLVSGDYLINHGDYENIEAYCPIGIRTFIDTGTFHGSGLFDLLFSSVRELERLLKSLYNNIRDIDEYGFLVLPHGGFNHDTLFKDVGEKLKVAYYEPDYTGADVKPFMVTPYNAGDAPGKVAGLAKAMLEGISPIKDLSEEKGRIDSAAGLQFLDEQIGRFMTNATNNLRGAFSDMYRGLASDVLHRVAESPNPVPVGKLNVELAGAVIDPETQRVSFQENPLPTVGRLDFGVRGRTVQSQTAKLERAMDMVEKKVADPLKMILYFLKEGMEPPMYIDEEKAAYDTIVRNILLLFGNGQNPGQVIVTPHNVMPQLQLRVLGAFMNSPVLGLATPEVQNSFIDYRESLLQLMGPILPPGTPPPDDVAMIQQEIMPKLMEAQQQGPQAQPQGAPR